MDTQSALSYLSKKMFAVGYSLEVGLSNVNDSFTLSRLMKRSTTFCDPAHDEYSQLIFFVKYTESVSTIFKPIRRRTPTLFKFC